MPCDQCCRKVQVVCTAPAEQASPSDRQLKASSRLAMQSDIDCALGDDDEGPQCRMPHTTQLVDDKRPNGSLEWKVQQMLSIGDHDKSMSVKIAVGDRACYCEHFLFTLAWCIRGRVRKGRIHHSIALVQ